MKNLSSVLILSTVGSLGCLLIWCLHHPRPAPPRDLMAVVFPVTTTHYLERNSGGSTTKVDFPSTQATVRLNNDGVILPPDDPLTGSVKLQPASAEVTFIAIEGGAALTFYDRGGHVIADCEYDMKKFEPGYNQLYNRIEACHLRPGHNLVELVNSLMAVLKQQAAR